MEVYQMLHLTGEEELSPGPYQYQAPGTSSFFPNSLTEQEVEGWHFRDYTSYA